MVHELPDPGSFQEALRRLDAELARPSLPAAGDRPRLPITPMRDTPLDSSCKELLAVLKKRCPGLLPEIGVEPGTSTRPVPVNADDAVNLLATSVRQAVAVAATGRLPQAGTELPRTALWQEGADALLVLVGDLKIELGEGEVRVHVPVRCDQLPDSFGLVSVLLVVGTADRPTGMFAAAPSHPEGPAVVTNRWGEPLTALAWAALLDVAAGVARHSGRDLDDAGLVPAAIIASRNGIVVLPQARHSVDRRPVR